MSSNARWLSLSAALLLVIPALAYAQQPPASDDTVATAPAARNEGGVGVGVKGGPIFATLNQASSNFSNNNGFIGGLFFGGNRHGVVGVTGELLYARKGAQISGVSTNLYYFEIPILLRINVGSGNINRGVAGYIIAGPAFDILLKARQANFDVKSNYQQLDLNAVFGAGVEVSRFIIEGREDIGYRNITKIAGAPDLKTRAFIVMFGLRFN